MAGLFSKKKASCALCKKEITHTHKPKRSWKVEGSLCADCYLDLLEKNFEDDPEDRCAVCSAEPGSFNLWRPKKGWGVKGFLCKSCFEEREREDDDLRNSCCQCGSSTGIFPRRAKEEWGMKGFLCRQCWKNAQSRQP
ncbi:MAG: hypothetical protein KGI33_11285 [Thaumarchaeota archaeon]|nr:hypothetical protein [Nitrososphaerota archaeon]